MIEVIYLISRARPSGPVNQALNILLGMKMNNRVHARLVSLAPEENNNSWMERFHENGIEVVQFNKSLMNTWKCISMLEKYVHEHNIQVIHSAGYRADFVSLMAKCSAKKVSTQRCMPNEVAEKLPRPVRPILESIHLSIIKRMDGVVACSRSLQRVFFEQYGINAFAVQNGVNTSFFTPVDPLQKNDLRIKLGIPGSIITYLVLGRLSERKNIGIIIDAFRRVNRRDIQLLIVGDGPLRQDLELKAGKDKRIFFTGSTKTPLAFIQASDVLISSALAEGLPNTVLEALSCGLPCILSDISPHLEIVQGTGLECVFNPQLVEDLIGSVLSSIKWDLKEKAHLARQLAEKEFGLERLANDYEKVYNGLLKEE